MKKPLSYYTMLAKRWAWMIILGILICGGATYIISKITRPVYEAAATLIVSLGTSSSPYDNLTASVQAVPTYAQLLTSPTVLNSVVAQHPGLTLQQLSAMLNVKDQPNTQLIELDVDNTNPSLAAELANEVSQSFAQFANDQLPGTIQILPAQQPTIPIRPKTLQNTAIGALVGLGLALALIVIFEWIDDRPSSPEEIQEMLGNETVVIVPRLSRRQYVKPVEEIPALAEGCRKLCAGLTIAQRINPFKLVMVTSALAGEGKSTIASDLAAFLAMTGKRTLLVDANLRNPALAQHFELETPAELASGLVVTWPEIQEHLNGQQTSIMNLHILTAGVLDLRVLTAGVSSSASTDLLQSPWVDQLFEHFKKAPFDYVIFDTSPLLSAAETQILAAHVHTAILVVDGSKTSRKVLLQVKHATNRTLTRVLGIVLNKSPWPTPSDHRSTHQHSNRTRTYSTSTILSPETPLLGDSRESMDGSSDPNMTITLRRPRESGGDS